MYENMSRYTYIYIYIYIFTSNTRPLVIEFGFCTGNVGCSGSVRIQRSSALHVLGRCVLDRCVCLVLQTHAMLHLLCEVVASTKRSLKQNNSGRYPLLKCISFGSRFLSGFNKRTYFSLSSSSTSPGPSRQQSVPTMHNISFPPTGSYGLTKGHLI